MLSYRADCHVVSPHDPGSWSTVDQFQNRSVKNKRNWSTEDRQLNLDCPIVRLIFDYIAFVSAKHVVTSKADLVANSVWSIVVHHSRLHCDVFLAEGHCTPQVIRRSRCRRCGLLAHAFGVSRLCRIGARCRRFLHHRFKLLFAETLVSKMHEAVVQASVTLYVVLFDLGVDFR
jgi:hypothetical protein